MKSVNWILFSLSILYLLTRIFPQKVIVAYGIILISASPGIVFTLSDIGLLEQTTYGMLFAGSFLHYLTSPSRKTLASVVLSLVFLILSGVPQTEVSFGKKSNHPRLRPRPPGAKSIEKIAPGTEN